MLEKFTIRIDDCKHVEECVKVVADNVEYCMELDYCLKKKSTDSDSYQAVLPGTRLCFMGGNQEWQLLGVCSSNNHIEWCLSTKMSSPKTVEERTNKKNDVKARSLLLMALPNDHQLTFNQYTDAKTMFATIEAQFGEIETMSTDDLYNNFKIVEQDVKKSVGTSNGNQNMAFMTTPSTGSINDVSTANTVSTGSTNINTASSQTSTSSISDNVVYAFMVENPNGSNLLHQDLEQIHEDYLEAMDLKWQLSLLPRSKDGQFSNQDNTRKQGSNEDTSSKAMLAIDGVSFDWSDMTEEQILTNIALMAFSDSEDLDKLLGSQIADKSKKGLGYHAVSPSHPLIYNALTKLYLSYSGLDEFKEPEFKGYSPRNDKQESNINYDKTLETSEENFDDSFLKQQVSEDESSFVESPLKFVENYIVFYTPKKIEFVKPKLNEKPVKRTVRSNNASLVLKRNYYIDAQGNPHLNDKGFVDSGCSRHMTGNIAYLSYFKEFDRGYVTFGGGSYGGKISSKGILKTDNIDFDDVYFVNELKFNLFSVLQMCDKKNYVLFTNSGCLVFSPNFRLPDECQILLKIPREGNMYIFDMKNMVPKEGLTCLVAKATLDESMLWHTRLGHINFKNINKLVKDNLVRGLPSKRFENDQTYVACLKGKQHRASCKTKVLNPITKPLFMLHIDLFGPTFMSSLMHKKYCLVVIDDYSRFTWVFFLKTKDETCEILKNFIKEIENLVDKKVKIIRSDNGTEFNNKVMDDFCKEKGIRREYSVARTPQQNGVAERRNRTLVEAAKTMVLVVKPHNKTPYELFRGVKPSLSFMRPFGCHVTILNTLDNLGKFNGKGDEGFFVGYSLSSKTFRVYNTRTRKVEESLHIGFLENKPILEGNGPKWLFDIDSLTQSMNYVPVDAGTTTNEFVGTQGDLNVGTSTRIDGTNQDCIVMPIWKDASYFDSSSKDDGNDEPQPSRDHGKKIDAGPSNASGLDDEDRHKSSTPNVITAGPSVNTASANFSTGSLNINIVSLTVITTRSNLPPFVSDIFSLRDNATHEPSNADLFGEETDLDMMISDIQSGVQTRGMTKTANEQGLLSAAYDRKPHEDLNTCMFFCFLSQEEPKRVSKALRKRAIGTKWIFKNKKDERGIVVRNKARIEAVRLFLAYASFMRFMVYQVDVKSAFLYGQIEKEVYVCQPPGFEYPDYPD
ncbi:putative ribonuclease H-like domain-containing protein, partial [Tanacetum coccineum]